MSHLIWVYIVCSGMSVGILKINLVKYLLLALVSVVQDKMIGDWNGQLRTIKKKKKKKRYGVISSL